MFDLRVSVVTAVMNGEAHLARFIDNVRSQDYANLEHVVIDGKSTDGTLRMLQAHPHIRWISEPDKGIYDAWNKGVGLSTGDWLIFLGADDFFAADDVVSRMVDAIKRMTGGSSPPLAIYGNIEILDPVTLESVELRAIPWVEMKDRYEYFRPALPRFPEVFFHRSLMAGGPPFDVTYKIAGDTKFMLSVIERGVTPVHVDLLVSRMMFGGTSARPDNLWKAAIEIRRACKELRIRVPTTHLVKEWIKILGKIAILNHVPPTFANAIANWYRVRTGRGPLSHR